MANATRTFAAPPPAIMELGTIFDEAGEELTLVGGPVRDAPQGAVVEIFGKIGNSGRLFGAASVTAIADAVREQLGQTIDRRRVIIASPTKAVGDYTVTVGLHTEVSANLKVRVSATK